MTSLSTMEIDSLHFIFAVEQDAVSRHCIYSENRNLIENVAGRGSAFTTTTRTTGVAGKLMLKCKSSHQGRDSLRKVLRIASFCYIN